MYRLAQRSQLLRPNGEAVDGVASDFANKSLRQVTCSSVCFNLRRPRHSVSRRRRDDWVQRHATKPMLLLSRLHPQGWRNRRGTQ